MDVEDYNSMAREALRRAQHARGVRSAEAFAKLMAERTGGPPTSSTYHRWLRGENPIPAWALLAAAEEANTDLGALVSSSELPGATDDRLGHVEDLVGILQAEMMEVRERLGLPLASGRVKRADDRSSVARRAES